MKGEGVHYLRPHGHSPDPRNKVHDPTKFPRPQGGYKIAFMGFFTEHIDDSTTKSNLLSLARSQAGETIVDLIWLTSNEEELIKNLHSAVLELIGIAAKVNIGIPVEAGEAAGIICKSASFLRDSLNTTSAWPNQSVRSEYQEILEPVLKLFPVSLHMQMVPEARLKSPGLCEVLSLYMPADEFDEEIFERAWAWLRRLLGCEMAGPTACSSICGGWDEKPFYPQSLQSTGNDGD